MPLIENGFAPDDPITKMTVERYLSAFKDTGVDTVIMGCTHYPLLKDYFRRHLPKDVRVISQDELMGAKLKDYLARHIEIDICLSRNSELRVMVSSLNSHYSAVAAKMFSDIAIEEVK